MTNRRIVCIPVAFCMGLAVGWWLTNRIPDPPHGSRTPEWSLGLGTSFSWDPKERARILDRGKLGYLSVLKRYQKTGLDAVDPEVLAADLELLGRFRKCLVETSEVDHFLLLCLRCTRFHIRTTAAVAILHNFDTISRDVEAALYALDGSDWYLSKVIMRVKMKRGNLPNTHENWVASSRRGATTNEDRSVGTDRKQASE